VVSGRIRGLTTTIPLYVEILYNEYNFVGAFAVASLLVFLALVTLVVQHLVAWLGRRRDDVSPGQGDLTAGRDGLARQEG
jgi:sulfate transport system permease protein